MTDTAKSKPVVFLDGDHVIALAKAILARDEPGKAYARDFFLPEIVDMNALSRLSEPLRENLATTALGPDDGRAGEAEVLVFRRGHVDRNLLDRFPRLKLIQRLGESPHMIDLDAARARGIAISCLPRQTLAHVAEHVILLSLCLLRQHKAAFGAFAESGAAPGKIGDVSYNWPGITGISTLFGKTLGIIGMGEIGALLAERAAAFGMHVLFTDSAPVAIPAIAALGARQVELDELLAQSDIVSIHVPPRPDAAPLFGAAEIVAMRPGSLLINTSRGSLVDEDALYHALTSGRIAGAGLDVHAHEPRGPKDRFAALDNVVLTPHIGGGSRLGVLAEIAAIYENIEAVLSGHLPTHGVIDTSEKG
ncbi:2-hydroxyacid dehydrogenase [Sinorhizobium fredii]|uniref:2-hydroxyacid dehydrogenase n=1 Tax=Rhizobium fredii TaxID=380 RepID=UPI0006947CBF|nr:NAD(P)-dependent oxidoreductase [Sinorhizobium fredii]WOS65496.1 NAD(P)-dependent oxidoreductase [Sinorhizobium fredii GR64]